MIYFVTVDEVLNIHDQQIKYFGGSEGTRDMSLLESALKMREQGFGGEYFHSFPFEIAAAYMFHISKNHPFVDGNKRTSTNVALTFLLINGYKHCFELSVLEEIVVEVAQGKYTKEDIAKLLETSCRPIKRV